MTPFALTFFHAGFAYHWHTNRRLLQGIAQLNDDAYRLDRGYSRGSIHNTLLHLLNTDRLYRVMLETGTRPPPLDPASLPDLPALQAAFEKEEAAWQTSVAGLTGEALEAEALFTLGPDNVVPAVRWHLLQQVLLHGMQHHTELAHALTEKGHSPGDLDFIFFTVPPPPR